jgi:F-box/leucine-rich repeat protein 2/20
MASSATPSVYETPEAASPAEQSGTIALEQPRLKGRQRLIQGLQRISSSPTLAQMGRRRASSNPYPGRSNMSAVSLASPLNLPFDPNYGASMSSQSSSGSYSTAPTSVPNTPDVDISRRSSLRSRLAIRKADRLSATTGLLTPRSLPLPMDGHMSSRAASVTPLGSHAELPEMVEDYFSQPISTSKPARTTDFDFWASMPNEIKLSIFGHLKPKELVRASIVSKAFHQICFDGQLWTSFDASSFYKEIPAESLAKIITAAGPFVKNLNLRGCVQVEHYKRAEVVAKACKNLINATLEGCRNFQRATLHSLLSSNERLAHLNLTGLTAVNNGTCKIIARSCPQLEVFNVSWCTHMDTRGIRMILAGCPKLRDLRAGEVRGFNDIEVAQDIFDTNNLESLVLNGCSDLDDNALKVMIHGQDPEIDVLEDRPIVPPRRLRHLELSRCTRITNQGIKALTWNVPHLEALHLTGCTSLSDDAFESLFATTPRLSHLDLEEISDITNSLLSNHIAKAPFASVLQHLSISYCESLGDAGMLPVMRACNNLRSVDMDNTRVSDLTLAEAVGVIRERSSRTTNANAKPDIGLHMVVYDCTNVTWTGIREILNRNTEILKGSLPGAMDPVETYPTEIITLKCFYGWQPTVDEHMRRVLRGDSAAARRLERKWADYMVATEELGAGGAGHGQRRRRRRAREAAAMHADEEGGEGMVGIGRRRRARSGGCMVM